MTRDPNFLLPSAFQTPSFSLKTIFIPKEPIKVSPLPGLYRSLQRYCYSFLPYCRPAGAGPP